MKDKITLNVGNVFRQSWKGCTNPITFEVLSLDREHNNLKVKCSQSNRPTWEEDWNDLDITENAFYSGEYILI